MSTSPVIVPDGNLTLLARYWLRYEHMVKVGQRIYEVKSAAGVLKSFQNNLVLRCSVISDLLTVLSDRKRTRKSELTRTKRKRH